MINYSIVDISEHSTSLFRSQRIICNLCWQRCIVLSELASFALTVSIKRETDGIKATQKIYLADNDHSTIERTLKMAKQFKLPGILPLHRCHLNEESDLFNKYREVEIGDTIDCHSGVIYHATQMERNEFDIKSRPILNFDGYTLDIYSKEDISKHFSASLRLSAGGLGRIFGIGASLEGKFQRIFDRNRSRQMKLWTSDFTLNTQIMRCQPKAQQMEATHYVKEKVNGGQMHFMATSEIIEDIKMRFNNLSAGAGVEHQGVGLKAKIGGGVDSEQFRKRDEGQLACFSTVGDFFSYNDCNEESLGKKLQSIPVENLQPKEIILEPLPLTLVLSNMGVSQQMQQHAKTEFNKLTEILTDLEKYLKLTSDAEIKDGVKKIEKFKKEIEDSCEATLQDIKTLYDPTSSQEKKLEASTSLSKLDCETAGSKLDKLREDVTNIVLENQIPKCVRRDSRKIKDGKLAYRVAIIGKTGSGKSSLANYILGQDVFNVGDRANVTTTFAKERVTIDGIKLDVYDTPGFYDKNGENDLAKLELQSAQKDGLENGFDAFIYVVNCNVAEEARRVFKVIKKEHGNNIKDYTIVVFNRVKGKIEDAIKSAKQFREINAEVGKRAIGVRCHDWRVLHPNERTETNRKLLQMIQNISHDHKGKRFTKE